MFEVENKEKLRIINAETLDPVTDWEEATKEGFYKLLKSITGLVFCPHTENARFDQKHI